jgi:hypothetical protein
MSALWGIPSKPSSRIWIASARPALNVSFVDCAGTRARSPHEMKSRQIFIHAQRWQALTQAGSRIAVSNERLVNLLVHNCQGRPICCYSPHVFSKKKKGAALPRSQLSTSNITSSMIGAPRGKLATPITDRTDILPPPNTSRKSSDTASAMIGWLTSASPDVAR